MNWPEREKEEQRRILEEGIGWIRIVKKQRRARWQTYHRTLDWTRGSGADRRSKQKRDTNKTWLATFLQTCSQEVDLLHGNDDPGAAGGILRL